jgi:hypothetical protein
MKLRSSFPALALIALLASCGMGKEVKDMKFRSSTAVTELQTLLGARIFFGHQSVGYNILDGLSGLNKDFASLSVVEGRDANALNQPRLLHSTIGGNGDPLGKIRDFVSVVESGIGAKADIALLKFCYVDFSAETDVGAVYTAYKDALSKLKAEFPKTSFPMVTIPLTTIQRGPKAWAKRILGRPLGSEAENAVRERLNEKIRGEEAIGTPVFDLALAEATGQDGSVLSGSSQGARYLALRDEYSSDGGHLNELGEKVVAVKFASFLAGLVSAR